jgi:FkbM family methyltransferase
MGKWTAWNASSVAISLTAGGESLVLARCNNKPIDPASWKTRAMRTLKQCLQSMLKRAGVYYRLKNSHLYDLYWSIADRRWIDARNKELDFYRSFLSGFCKGDLVFDVGANDGTKTDIFLRLGARVISIDPDEVNQSILRDKFQRYRLVPKRVVIVGKALSDRSATETMWIDGPGSAVNTLSQKWAETLKTNKDKFEHAHFGLDFARSKTVETTTLEELILAHGLPVFVKIDVEGYEASVIRGLKHPVPFLSFEMNLPEFRQEGLECVRLLGDLAADGRFNYAADLQRGTLGKWLEVEEFSRVIEQCSEGTIEVFWRTPLTHMR